MHIRLIKSAKSAILPILCGVTIASSAIISHNAGVVRDRQAVRAAIVSCQSTHNALTDLVTTVGLLLGHDPSDVAATTSLQTSVDKSYDKCIAGVS